MYVDYEFYKATFGDAIPESVFPRVEMQAEAHIRALTYIKGDIFATASDSVKLAVCAAAEIIYNNEQTRSTGAGVKSESNDGYSVTYVAEAVDGQTAEEALRKKVAESVRIYLLPTGWLSRQVKMGGGCCDDCADNCHGI